MLFEPFELGTWMMEQGVPEDQVVRSGPGGRLELDGIIVRMVPAVHGSGLPDPTETTPYPGVSAGFVITFENDWTVYFDGNSSATQDMALVADLYQPNAMVFNLNPRREPLAAAAAMAATAIVLIGMTVGLVAGYVGGLVDDVLMRLVDVLLAFPSLVLALAIVGTLGPSLRNVMIGMVAVWWVDYARVIRGLTIALRERDFVASAHCAGASAPRVIVHHLLPNVVPSVIVLATLELGSLMLAISGLSFLGLGAQPPTPEWGTMLNDGRPFFQRAPQLMLYPGLAISLVVVGCNLVGDGLRDVLDPRLKR